MIIDNKSQNKKNVPVTSNEMNVLSIGTDRNLFQKDSAVRRRIIEYGSLVHELHIIVFAKKSLGLQPEKISANVWIYPTNSISRWFYVQGAIKIGKLLVANGQWLITCQDPFETGLAGWRIARARKTPLQFQIHADFLSPYFSKGSLLNKVRVRIAKFLIPKAACIRVVSQRIKDSLLTAHYKPQTEPTVLPIFVDVEAIRSASVGEDLHKLYSRFDSIILMVSRLEREKNIPLALSVFKEVLKKYPNTGLVIAGEGKERKALKLQVTRYELQDNVVFIGECSDVISYYKTADVFLHAANYEGYGLVLVEAAAAGCPIVTTDVGIAREFFEDDGSAFVCDVGDAECLADKVVRMLENKQFRNTFILKAQNALERRIKQKSRKEYLAQYGEIWRKCSA